MREPSPFWPRGLLPGAVLAGLLIAPVVLLTLADSSRRPARPFPGGFHPGPPGLHSEQAFFAGKLAVVASALSWPNPPVPPFLAASPGPGRPPRFGPPHSPNETTLRFRLENRSQQDLAVDIVGVTCELGDVAPTPGRVMLAPRQSVNLESQVRAGPPAGRHLPMKVVLRLGELVETQELNLESRPMARNGF